MGLRFAEKAIYSTKKIDFPKIRYKNVQYFNLEHAPKQNFGVSFFLPLSFPFSRPFYSRYLLRFIFFLAAVKKLSVYGQSLEMGPRSIIGVIGHFTGTIFAPKLITLFFTLLRRNAVDIQHRLLCG